MKHCEARDIHKKLDEIRDNLDQNIRVINQRPKRTLTEVLELVRKSYERDMKRLEESVNKILEVQDSWKASLEKTLNLAGESKQVLEKEQKGCFSLHFERPCPRADYYGSTCRNEGQDLALRPTFCKCSRRSASNPKRRHVEMVFQEQVIKNWLYHETHGDELGVVDNFGENVVWVLGSGFFF